MLENLVNDFKNAAPEFIETGCIVNGTLLKLEDVEKMGWIEFASQSKLYMPTKLYRYFPNKEVKTNDDALVNYSIQALENNTVYLQSPCNFDDVYDSEIYVDYSEYERLRLIQCCHRCEINVDECLTTNEIGNIFLKTVYDSFCTHTSYDYIFTKPVDTELEDLENKLFCLQLRAEMQKTDDLGKGLSAVLGKEYCSLITELKTKFRVSCFATTPFSQLMWGGMYADCHKGFCLEYTVLPNEETYKDVYYNLFPMIYCKKRSNITASLVAMRGNNVSMDELWNIYFHGALRKSIDWVFQNEWRLLLPLGNHCEDYNVQFFPLTKVFLGNHMPYNQRKQIIDICNRKGIPYIGVRKNQQKFEMQECKIKCENCLNYINKIDE